MEVITMIMQTSRALDDPESRALDDPESRALDDPESRALDDLDGRWGGAYDLAVTRSGWVAKRLDNNRALVADSPEGLRELIGADYAAEPVSREAVSRSAGS
jgi:hypothetical protein